MSNDPFSVAIFPYLKTELPVSIGGLNFRSTSDIDNLPPRQAESVAEIARMLFLQDNLRIISACYSIVPFVGDHNPSPSLAHLVNLQSAVAYLYASPHPTRGDVFLSTEHASMVIFSPGEVSIFLVRPEFNVEPVDDVSKLAPDEHGNVRGYAGLYNFRHHFWVARGSRVYGPQPQLTLNIVQDLRIDLERAVRQREHFGLLFQLLERPVTTFSMRIFTAIRWFNAACREAMDEHGAIVNLAIAFESLLGLPQAEKTDRLVDSISLLLGRVPRLDVWARQFYEARSQVVHEGYARQLHFIVTDSSKTTSGAIYQSLLAYGGQIFRLCLGTLLVGADMAEEAGLEEKLVTNQERFEKVCKILSNEVVAPCDQLDGIRSVVDNIELYRFVADSSLKLESMIGAARLAAKALLACENSPRQELTEALEALVAAKRSPDHLEELEGLRGLDAVFRIIPNAMETERCTTIHTLIGAVWGYVFAHYFWLKQGA